MIHREGYPTIGLTILFSIAIIGAAKYLSGGAILLNTTYIISAVLLVIVLQFFRNPSRSTTVNDKNVIAPADGKVVVIEEVEETEYFKDKRIQVSIFMSPFNVHVNRFPIAGFVKYVKYHAGLYLVAWHPKSSTENERSTVVIGHPNGKAILFRQIAGALARRIVYYCKEGDNAIQGAEFGFIKFGSRVDVFLPLGTKIEVKLNQTVIGGETVIASFNEG